MKSARRTILGLSFGHGDSSAALIHNMVVANFILGWLAILSVRLVR